MSTFDSHFGVYAVITDEEGENILLIRKARGPYKGRLDLPGGAPDPEELLEDTLVREVAEETGGRVVGLSQIGADSILFQYGEGDGQRTLRHIGVFFDVEAEDVELGRGDGQDSHGAEWYALDTLEEEHVTPFVWRLIEGRDER